LLNNAICVFPLSAILVVELSAILQTLDLDEILPPTVEERHMTSPKHELTPVS